MKRLFFFHFLLWILPGCSLLPSTLVSSSPSSPSVLPAPSYPLLSPATYGRSYVAQHLLEGQAHGEDFTLQIHVEIDPDGILLLGFTPWQTRAFVLRYDGTTVDFENFTNREMPFPPARILSDLQQVLWPSLPNHNEWHVVDDPQTHERRVTFQDRLITRIRYQGVPPMQGVVELDNVALGYQLRIHIHEDEPEQPQN
jgi:uncharacterized protein DUF3261